MNEENSNVVGDVAALGALRRDHRVVLIFGSLVLLVLCGFAWTYYLERVACADGALFSMLMVDGKVPVSVLGRYGSWIAQLLPVALLKMGAPLDAVLRSYSVSFILFHALIFWLLAFKLKDRRATYALPLALTVGFHYMFYFGVSELYQGFTLTLLLWAMLARAVHADTHKDLLRWSVLVVLLNVWISFYHQMLVLPLVFILGHEFIALGRKERMRIVALGSIAAAWYVIRISAMPVSTYEDARMPTLQDVLHYGAQWRDLESTAHLLQAWTKFKGLLLLIMAGMAVGLHQRAWLRTAWTVLFSGAFLLLILIVDRDGKAITIYENYYPVLGLVWAVHFIALLPEQGRWYGRIRNATLIVACSLGLLQIHRAHYRLSEKVAYVQRITAFWEAQGKQKVLVEPTNFPWVYTVGDWPFGLESALISGVRGPQYTTNAFTSTDARLMDTLTSRRYMFLGPTWSARWFGDHEFEPQYFDLPGDGVHAWVNTCDSTFDHKQLVLRGPTGKFRMAPDVLTVVPIAIHNPTDRRMPSCTTDGVPVRLSYRLFHKDGTEYLKGSELTALETDIPAGMTYHQGLVIKRPYDNGEYWVLVDLLVNNQPFGKYFSFDLVVDRRLF